MPERRELLRRLLVRRGVRFPRETPIPRRPDRASAPLSFGQEQLWFLAQMDPREALYNVPGALRLAGRLNPSALEWTLNEIVRRHDSLRTTFTVRDGVPVQSIAAYTRGRLELTDLRSRPERAAEQEALRLVTAGAHRPFDLERGPLFRFSLIRLAEEDHILVCNFHHIVMDGWSMGVFTGELDVLYRAARAGRPSPLPELPLQFGDFAGWERELVNANKMESSLAWWRNKIGAGWPELRLPHDRPRSGMKSLHGRHEPVILSPPLSEKLRTLSRRKGVTLFVTLLAGFQALLHCYSGQDDIVIGTAFANRSRKELEGIIGFLVNTLPIRTDLSGDPSFDELLLRVRETSLGVATHQDVPLSVLIREVQPARDLNRNPLFQVEFSLLTPDHNPAIYGYGLGPVTTQTLNLPGLVASAVDVEYEVSPFDLSVLIWDLPEGIRGVLEYRTGLFDRSTMAGLADNCRRLLAFVAADPGVRLADVRDRFGVTAEQRRKAREKTYQTSLRTTLKRIRRRSTTPPGSGRSGETD